jgi:hypothetical protein
VKASGSWSKNLNSDFFFLSIIYSTGRSCEIKHWQGVLDLSGCSKWLSREGAMSTKDPVI